MIFGYTGRYKLRDLLEKEGVGAGRLDFNDTLDFGWGVGEDLPLFPYPLTPLEALLVVFCNVVWSTLTLMSFKDRYL